MCSSFAREVKIVLKGLHAAHLFDLQDQSRKLHLPCYLVHDAGRTQVKIYEHEVCD